MSQDIATFLRARYADHKSAALGAKGSTDGCWTQDDGPPEDIVLYDKSGKLTMGQARHIARHDPAFVLADLDAKGRIVARHESCGSGSGYCDDGGHGWDEVEGGGCAELGDLALPFAAHPEYKETWRP